MKKLLLTSAGFETEQILETFRGLLEKEPAAVKALFIPTAAISPAAISVLPECMNDLLKAGILSENICVFDLHRNMEYSELGRYDVVYFTGGNTQYLLDRINDTGFYEPLNKFIDNGGIYVGVSAGSMVAANNLSNSLKLINCTLEVHTETGSQAGVLNVSENPHIKLKDNNAILISGDKYEIIE
jgi:peptidase E